MTEQPKPQISIQISGGTFQDFITGDKTTHVTGDYIERQSNDYGSNPEASAIAELHQLIQSLQQKHPHITPEQAPAIVQAEITQIQQTQPQRWAILQQNLLNRDRWLQGGKNAAVKVGEHYAQNSPIGIALVAVFEKMIEP